MKRTEELKIIETDKLIPYAKNARTHSKEQILKLRSSLREFGFVNPVLIDKENNILAGHGRVMAAKEEGIKEVPCVLVDHLTEAQKKAYILADNRLAIDAGWDKELLALELEYLKELDFDVNLTGFEAAEIDELFNQVHDKDVTDDDFDVDAELENGEKPIVQPGDIWLLGRHRLLCGDATEPEDIKKLMDSKKANLCVTDPPYNCDYTGGTGMKIQNDKMSSEAFKEFLLKAFKNIYDNLADGAAFYSFHSDSEKVNFFNATVEAGFHYSTTCIWVKNALVLSRLDYQMRHEPIIYAFKNTSRHKWYGGRKLTSVWEFDRPTRSKLHPTMKPLVLVAFPIKNSSLENSIVLDTFGGSGSTLISCEQLNRICYMTELDPIYSTIILKRYIEYAGTDEGVFVERNGEKIPYSELVKEVVTRDS